MDGINCAAPLVRYLPRTPAAVAHRRTSKRILCRFIRVDCRRSRLSIRRGAARQHRRDRQTHHRVRSPLFSRRLRFATRAGGANLHLWRDADAHANWIRNAPENNPGQRLPAFHSLSIPAAHLELHDDRRHLMFDGTVSAGEEARALPLRISIKGTSTTGGHRHHRWRSARYDVPRKNLITSRWMSARACLSSHRRGVLSHPFDFRARRLIRSQRRRPQGPHFWSA